MAIPPHLLPHQGGYHYTGQPDYKEAAKHAAIAALAILAIAAISAAMIACVTLAGISFSTVGGVSLGIDLIFLPILLVAPLIACGAYAKKHCELAHAELN